ncbi:MAG TPA: hypothetical protein VFC34_16190 [Puia sp.]|nr:hypothetical protein [Puia sp.]
MKARDLMAAFAEAGKRVHLIGNLQAGAIIALDMEGRIFTVLNGQVLNRVNPAAVAGYNCQTEYQNPGGDGLWPAPEGTSLGYQYSTGLWRVPPGLRGVRYLVTDESQRGTIIAGEVDLINNQGHGVPTIFKRRIKMKSGENEICLHIRESITYIGHRELKRKDCLLAPWTLCQFDSGPECAVAFPCSVKSSIWDLYDESSMPQRKWEKNICHTVTDGSMRYQIALDKKVPWIEFRDPSRNLIVRRSAKNPPVTQPFIDIRDANPVVPPSKKGVRYSVYSDTAKFMEIEAVGGSPKSVVPGAEMHIDVTTRFRIE